MFPATTQVLIIVGIIILLSIGISFYFAWKTRMTSSDVTAPETTGIQQEDDPVQNEEALDPLPVITEMNTEDIPERQYEKFKLPAGAIDMLQQTVHAAFPVMKDLVSYKVQFTPETLRQLKEGTMNLGKRTDGSGFTPMARTNDSKKFVEQAALVKNLNPALVANASMNLLTAAVGQKQLAAMQTSLDSIEDKIDTLLKYRTNDHLGRIKGRIMYINIIATRFLQRGMLAEPAEDSAIEESYRECIQDISTLHQDQLDILKNIEQIKEREKVRAFRNAKYYKELSSLLDDFNAKQEIIDLNFKFAKEYYEPYVRKVRKAPEQDIPTDELAGIQEENDALVERIYQKLDALQNDYKVLIGLNRDKYMSNTNAQIKELVPVKISYHKQEMNETPGNMIVGVDGDNDPYAYLPVD